MQTIENTWVRSGRPCRPMYHFVAITFVVVGLVGVAAHDVRAQSCPLPGGATDICAPRQGLDCIGGQDQDCLPILVIAVGPEGGGGFELVECGCATSGECGPVDISAGDIISCAGNCSLPQIPPCQIFIDDGLDGIPTGRTSAPGDFFQHGLRLFCDCPQGGPKACEGKGEPCGPVGSDCICETRPGGTLNCADKTDFESGIHGFCPLGTDFECEEHPGTKCFVNSEPPVCAHNCGDHEELKVCDGKGTACGPVGSDCICETRGDETLNCADLFDFESGIHGFCPNGSDSECSVPGTKCFVNSEPPVCAHNCGDHEELKAIPTVSEWGVVVMVLVLLVTGTIVFAGIHRRRSAAA